MATIAIGNCKVHHTILLNIVLLCFFSIDFNNLQAQKLNDSASKVAWLKKNAIAIRSIDSADEDFSDLMPLKKMIGEAQIVMLGETNHLIGSTYLAKTRIIKFLHQQMGFDLLTFESDMYGANKAWQLIKEGNNNPRDFFKHAVDFGRSEEYKPLINYIKKNASAARPLEIGGFDFSLNRSIPYNFLISDLRIFFKGFNYTTLSLDDSSAFAKHIRNSTSFGGFKAPPAWVLDTCSLLIKVIDSLAPKPFNFQTEFYLQILRSVKRFMQYHLVVQILPMMTGMDKERINYTSFNMRDEQMAENLLWYVKQYPKRKIIVWAHYAHLITRRAEEINIERSDPNYYRENLDLIYMGTLIKDSLQDKVYNIIITGNQGELGTVSLVESIETWRVAVPHFVTHQELESLLESAGFNYAYLNLKAIPKGGEWLKARFPMRVSPFEKNIGEWRKIIDGVFYIKNFAPTYVKEQ